MGNRILLLFFAVAALSLVFWVSASLLLRIRTRTGKAVRTAVWLVMLPLAALPLFLPFSPVRLDLFTDCTGGMRAEIFLPAGMPNGMTAGEEPAGDVSLTRNGRKTAEVAALLFLTLWITAGSATAASGFSGYWETLTFLTRNSKECRDLRALEIFERARKKAGVRRSVTLRVMHPDLKLSPCMCGTVSPGVFVGAEDLSECPDERLEMIFLHELIHIRHGDGLRRIAVLLLTSFHALLPVSGKVRRAAEEDAEFLCDRDVVGIIGRDRAGEYFGMILDVASRSVDGRTSGGAETPVSEAGELLKRRYQRISRGESPSGAGGRSVWLAPMTALLCNLLLVNLVTVLNPDDLRLDFVNPCLARAVTLHAGLDDPRDLTESAAAGIWSMELYAPYAAEEERVWYCTINEAMPEKAGVGEAYPVTPETVRLDDLALFPALRTLVLEGRIWQPPHLPERCVTIRRD